MAKSRKKKFYFDEDKVARVVRFIEALKHTNGRRWAGRPFILLPWQRQIIQDIFGVVDDEGRRRHRMAYVEIPKKNGKSELAAAIALYMLFGDDEPGAEVYLCAVDKTQATIVYKVAAQMVRLSPTLLKRSTVVDSVKRIVVPGTASFLQVLSADVPNKHGLNPSCIIFDELHAQPDRKLWDVMTFGSTDARDQPLIFTISTAGDDPDRTSIGWELHDRAEKVLSGDLSDPTFYPVIHGLGPDEDWHDPENWKRVNPSFGEVLSLEVMQEAYNSSVGNPAKEKLFRQLRLNQWVREKTTSWIPLSIWDENGGVVLTGPLLGRSCYGGIDLSAKLDMTAFGLMFPPVDHGEKWKYLVWYFVPEERIPDRVNVDREPYDKWVKDGYLIATPGNVQDQNYIKSKILEIRGLYDILEIGYDPWNASQLAVELQDMGLEMVEFGQTFKHLSPAMNELEKMLHGHELNHNSNPVLRWNFSNLVVKSDTNGNIKPIRGSKTKKIDGFICLLMALWRAYVHAKKRSVYEDRGVLSL